MGDITSRRRSTRSALLAVGALLAISSCSSTNTSSSATTATTSPNPKTDTILALASNKPTAELDRRYSSYNIEMVTVTGGSFWAPYGEGTGRVSRPPADLASPRLRALARALGPAYIRVSGSWVNNTWFDPNGTPDTKPPAGFGSVLTGKEWQGVGDFAKAVDGKIVTSYAVGAGNRDADGNWTPDQAVARMSFSKTNGIPVVAAEFTNEPSIPVGVPKGYSAEDHVKDFSVFADAAKRTLPDLKIVGPSATADIDPTVIPASIKAQDMVAGTHDRLDIFSYHFYPTKSKRCGGDDRPGVVLDKKFLDRVIRTRDFYEKIRDRYMPKAPMWVTELGEANCGGDPWASKFADAILYVDLHGQLASGNGDVVFHNTLMGSDYGLLDEDTLDPRPMYWAAVLWERLMGPTVLRPATSTSSDLRVYAQCTPGKSSKGVTYAVINTSAEAQHTTSVSSRKATVYTLTGTSLTASQAELNGRTLRANTDGTLPAMQGRQVDGAITLPPASVNFIVDPTTVAACS